MADDPREDDKEAKRRFNETVGNLLRTPHKRHTGGGKGREPKPAPNKN